MTDEKRPSSGLSRRDFLLASSATLGSAVLTLYGGAAHAARGGTLGSMPTRYRFFRLLTTGQGLGESVSDITAAVMMGSAVAPRIYFHASNPFVPLPEYQDGLYYVDVDWGGISAPSVVRLENPISQASLLEPREPPYFTGISQSLIQPDRIGTGDSNRRGHYVTTIQTADTGTTVNPASSPGVYLYRPEDTTFAGIAFVGDPVLLADGTVGKYGSTFGDVSLCDDDTVLVVASVIGRDGQTSQAVVVVPQADPSRAWVPLQSGSLLPGTSATLASFGLIDVAADDSFVVQATAARREPRAADRRPGTALISGNLRRSSSSYETLAASPHLVSRRNGRHRDLTHGETHLGPRVANGGRVAHVTHTTSHHHQLMHNGRGRRGPEVRRRVGERVAGGPGSSSASVAAISGPVVTDDGGLTYVTILNDDGTSMLTVSDGIDTAVILRGGVGTDSSGMVEGAVVNEILHGYHPTQVDDLGRIAFAAEFLKDASGDPNDPDNIEASLVVATPI